MDNPSNKTTVTRRNESRRHKGKRVKHETYSAGVLMKSIQDAFMEKYNQLIMTNVGDRAFRKKFHNMNKINLTHFILSNFSNYVNEKNKFNMVRYVNRFKNSFVPTNWDTKVLMMCEICNELLDEIIHYTGINMLIEFPNDTPNISDIDVYNLVNEETPVVYSIEITPRFYCVMTLNNQKAQEVSSLYDGRYVNVEEDEYYNVKCTYIQPIVDCRTRMFSWKENKDIEYVTIPFKSPRVIDIRDICYVTDVAMNHSDVRVSI